MRSSKKSMLLFLLALPLVASAQDFFSGDNEFESIDMSVVPAADITNDTNANANATGGGRRSLSSSSIYCVTMARTKNGVQTSERVYCKTSVYKSGTMVRNLDAVCNYGCYAYPGCSTGRMQCPNLDSPGGAAAAASIVPPWALALAVMGVVGGAGHL